MTVINKRRFSANPPEHDIAAKKPNYVSRFIFTSAVLGGGYAYYSGLSDDIIDFFKARFALVDAVTSSKDNSSSVYKLPKPEKSDSADAIQSNAVTKALPPPSLSDITSIDSVNSKSIPEIKDMPTSEPLEISKIPEKVEAVIDNVKQEVAEISEEVKEEMMMKYKKLKEQAAELENLMVSSERIDAVDNIIDVTPAEPPKVYESEEERLKAEFAALQRMLEQVHCGCVL